MLAYNVPGLWGELKLPRDIYPRILSGQIRRWDDPRIQTANPGVSLPHLNIVIVARQDSSGTTFALTNHLAAVSLAWREQGLGVGKLVEWPASAMLASGNEGVASRIKISEGSIGYVEYGFAKRLGLPMAMLQNKAGKFVSQQGEIRGSIHGCIQTLLRSRPAAAPHRRPIFEPAMARDNLGAAWGSSGIG